MEQQKRTYGRRSRAMVGRAGLWFLLALAGIFAVLHSCTKQNKRAAQGVIVVSIEPLRYFTEQIVGDRFEVKTIVPKGYSPETYEPTPQQLVEVSEASAYFKIGNMGFESTWLDKISKNELSLRVYNTSDSLLVNKNGMQLSTFDQHTWTTPQNAEVISKSICSALCRIDTVGAPIYQRNYANLVARIHSVDKRIHNELANLSSRAFVVAHPALTYFASQYGLMQLSIEKDGKEPTPQDLTELIRQCKQEKVNVVLVQPEFNRENAELIAREIGARVVDINPLNYQWDEEMLHVATVLKNRQ